MQSLFPQQVPNARGAAPPLISFHAGKCILGSAKPDGKIPVTCDPRRGKVTMEKMQDGVLHFKWTDRGSGRVEDDRMVFPGVIEFKKAKTGREGDRVYLLKYSDTTEKFMFWMQDKSDEKDADNCSKINEYANNPAALEAAVAALQAESANAAGGGRAGADAWMQMMGLGGAGGAAGGPDMSALAGMGANAPSSMPGFPEATVPPASTEANPFGALDLSSLLNQLEPPAAPTGNGEAAETSAPTVGQRPVNLRDVLTENGTIREGALDDPALRGRLIALMPEGRQTEEALQDTLTNNSTFTTGLVMLSAALYSDDMSLDDIDLPGETNEDAAALWGALRSVFPEETGTTATEAATDAGNDAGANAE